MNPEFELETFRRVVCNDDGSYVEIGPDADGLGLIELKYREKSQDHPNARLSLPPEQARLVAQAILRAVEEKQSPIQNILVRAPQ